MPKPLPSNPKNPPPNVPPMQPIPSVPPKKVIPPKPSKSLRTIVRPDFRAMVNGERIMPLPSDYILVHKLALIGTFTVEESARFVRL